MIAFLYVYKLLFIVDFIFGNYIRFEEGGGEEENEEEEEEDESQEKDGIIKNRRVQKKKDVVSFKNYFFLSFILFDYSKIQV